MNRFAIGASAIALIVAAPVLAQQGNGNTGGGNTGSRAQARPSQAPNRAAQAAPPPQSASGNIGPTRTDLSNLFDVARYLNAGDFVNALAANNRTQKYNFEVWRETSGSTGEYPRVADADKRGAEALRGYLTGMLPDSYRGGKVSFDFVNDNPEVGRFLASDANQRIAAARAAGDLRSPTSPGQPRPVTKGESDALILASVAVAEHRSRVRLANDLLALARKGGVQSQIDRAGNFWAAEQRAYRDHQNRLEILQAWEGRSFDNDTQARQYLNALDAAMSVRGPRYNKETDWLDPYRLTFDIVKSVEENESLSNLTRIKFGELASQIRSELSSSGIEDLIRKSSYGRILENLGQFQSESAVYRPDIARKLNNQKVDLTIRGSYDPSALQRPSGNQAQTGALQQTNPQVANRSAAPSRQSGALNGAPPSPTVSRVTQGTAQAANSAQIAPPPPRQTITIVEKPRQPGAEGDLYPTARPRNRNSGARAGSAIGAFAGFDADADEGGDEMARLFADMGSDDTGITGGIAQGRPFQSMSDEEFAASVNRMAAANRPMSTAARDAARGAWSTAMRNMAGNVMDGGAYGVARVEPIYAGYDPYRLQPGSTIPAAFQPVGGFWPSTLITTPGYTSLVNVPNVDIPLPPGVQVAGMAGEPEDDALRSFNASGRDRGDPMASVNPYRYGGKDRTRIAQALMRRPYQVQADLDGRLGAQRGDLVATLLDDQMASLRRLRASDFAGIETLLAQPFNVILTWGAGAYDLDLHMTGPTVDPASRFHIYYSAKGSLTEAPFAELIKDCICRSGSEVILTSQLVKGGVYRISAFNFGDQSATSTNLADASDATIQIVRGGVATAVGDGTTLTGGRIIYSGRVPKGRPGNTWTAVEINAANGKITAPGTITQSPGSEGVN